MGGVIVENTLCLLLMHSSIWNGKFETETNTISLDKTSADLQPALTAANADTFKIFVATVTGDKNGVKANTPVTIKSDVTQGTGGHNHTDTLQRPKGYLYSDQPNTSCDGVQPAACITGATDANGQFVFTFLASQVSGKHTVTATCDVCNGSKADLAIKVAVPGLSGITASPFYALNEENGDVLGAVTGNHTDNHYLVPEAASVLWRIAAAFQFEKRFAFIDPVTSKQLVLHLNDASLEWGGVFDICAISNACPDLGVVAWDEPHTEHRRGSVVDVRANNKPGAIPRSLTLKFQELANYYGADAHLEGGNTRHFHLRLLNRKE